MSLTGIMLHIRDIVSILKDIRKELKEINWELEQTRKARDLE